LASKLKQSTICEALFQDFLVFLSILLGLSFDLFYSETARLMDINCINIYPIHN